MTAEPESRIVIRREDPSDIERIYEVEASAFESRVQADLVDALRTKASPQISLVAEIADTIVGHIFFSPVRIDSAATPPVAAQLSPLAVVPEHQRTGVGKALIHAGLRACPPVMGTAIFLLGDPRYYAKSGFELAAPRGLFIEGPENPYLQVRELAAGALAGVEGQVHFHPVFDDF